MSLITCLTLSTTIHSSDAQKDSRNNNSRGAQPPPYSATVQPPAAPVRYRYNPYAPNGTSARYIIETPANEPRAAIKLPPTYWAALESCLAIQLLPPPHCATPQTPAAPAAAPVEQYRYNPYACDGASARDIIETPAKSTNIA